MNDSSFVSEAFVGVVVAKPVATTPAAATIIEPQLITPTAALALLRRCNKEDFLERMKRAQGFKPGFVLDLTYADLSGVDLSGLSLRGVNLTGANLACANLSGVDCTELPLETMNLRGIDFSGVSLVGVDLTKVNYNRLRLDTMDLIGAIVDEDRLAQTQKFRENQRIRRYEQAINGASGAKDRPSVPEPGTLTAKMADRINDIGWEGWKKAPRNAIEFEFTSFPRIAGKPSEKTCSSAVIMGAYAGGGAGGAVVNRLRKPAFN